MKKDILNSKIITIDNNKVLPKAINYIPKNDKYKNHLEYWRDYLKENKLENINVLDTLQLTRNMIGVKICLEGKIVFIDTSVEYNDYKTGIIFLPDNYKKSRLQLMALLTIEYDYLDILYNIEYKDNSLKCEERTIDREKKSKQKAYF